MVIVIDDANILQLSNVMEKVYRFRHALFVERLKWEECRRPDGREIDQFDGPGCIHLVAMENDNITAYSRFLPTTKPHLLSDVYPHLAQCDRPPANSRIYEWTRCGTLPSRREGRAGIIDPATAGIFTAAAEIALDRGLDGFLAQTHPILVNRLMSCGWDVEPLGLPTKYQGHSIMAIYAKLMPDTVRASRQFFNLQRSPLRTAAPQLRVDADPIDVRLRA